MTGYQNPTLAEKSLSYKPHYKTSERPVITSSQDSYKILIFCWDEGRLGFLEEFKILLLNRANRVIGVHALSLGGRCSTIADPKVIFSVALKAAASQIILAHNHLLSNLKASDPDLKLTKKMQLAGSLLDLLVIDHLILTKDGIQVLLMRD